MACADKGNTIGGLCEFTVWTDILFYASELIVSNENIVPDPLFDPEEQTTTKNAWISFLALPSIVFGREAIFLLEEAIGKHLQVDMANKNQTQPNCAIVKVEVDLFGEFPKRIRIGMKKKDGEISEK